MDKKIVWCMGKRFDGLMSLGLLAKESIKFLVDKKKSCDSWNGIMVFRPEDLLAMDLKSETILITSNMDSVITEIRSYCDAYNIPAKVLTYDEYLANSLGFGKEREKVISHIRKSGTINQKHLEQIKVFSNRIDALNCCPKGGVAAEIGVAYGDFSKAIIDSVKPDLFFAIDYFSQDNPYRCFMGRTDFMDTNKTHQEWYEERFSVPISQNKLKVIQGLSWDVLSNLPDDYLDFAYLDACHNYDAVHKDICMLYNKVKDGGIIAFNDYVCVNIYSSPLSYDSYYGVVPEVNRFINETGSKVIALALQAGLCNDVFVKLHK